MRQTLRDVACTCCGAVCDDLEIVVDGDRVVAVSRDCPLSYDWWRAQRSRAEHGFAELDGIHCEAEAAYTRAAQLLRNSQYPLIYGLSRSTTEGQRAAVALADYLGATIDTTASTGHAPSIMALQQVGESTSTLGEVKQRAELVIFWGSNPQKTHPRFIERYCPPKPGRKLIVVDVERTETADRSDMFISLQPGSDWETLTGMRLALRNHSTMLTPQCQQLVEACRVCKFGVVFFGAGLTRGRLAHRAVEALLQLVTDLNHHTRFYARRMRRYGDVAGADSVLAWQTGYPFGVNLSAGYPRYNPGEFTAPEMLSRGEPDLCLLIGSDTIQDFPDAAKEHLRRIPVLCVDSPEVRPPFVPTVRFTTAVYGVHKPGTAYRLDEIPIPLREVLPTNLPSDAEVLNEFLSRCKK